MGVSSVSNEPLGILQKIGAILTNDDGSIHLNREAIYLHPPWTRVLCREIAGRYMGENIHAVVGPGPQGAVLSQWTAYLLREMTGVDILSIYTDKTFLEGDDAFTIPRTYRDRLAHKRVLVVDGFLTNNSHAKRVVRAIRRETRGATMVGIGVFYNHDGITAETLEVPRLEALVETQRALKAA